MKTFDEIRDVIKKMRKEDIEGNKSIDAQRRLSLYSQLLVVVEKTALEEAKKTEQVYDKLIASIHKATKPVVDKLLTAQGKEHSGDSRYTAAIERLRKEFGGDND